MNLSALILTSPVHQRHHYESQKANHRVGKDICNTQNYQRAHFQSVQRTLRNWKNKTQLKKMDKKFE